MNKRDAELARQAGWPANLVAPVIMAKLAEFADLIRADEREACAAHYLTIMRKAIANEREACIDLVAMYGGPVDLEAAIRARGTT